MFDGIRTCDHAYARDSVDVYACVSDVRELGVTCVVNSGAGCGHSACEAADVACCAIGCEALVWTVFCCFGDLLVSAVDVLLVLISFDRLVCRIESDVTTDMVR